MSQHGTARAVRLAAALCLFLVTAPPALALSDGTAAGRTAFLKECSACHMAFPPQMLPRASWRKIMAGLSNHFGGDASLGPKTTREIEAYLTAHAAETSAFGRQFTAGLRPNEAPLRITDLPVWVSIHSEEVPSWAWKDPRVRSKANCMACHGGGGANEG